MQTWAAMFGLVLRDSGVAAQGQTPNAQMAQDAKTRCAMMLSQWMRRRWLVYHLQDTSLTCDGSLFYTIGTGGQFNQDRPDEIQAAYARQMINSVPNQVDYPLTIIRSYEDYSRITLKQLAASPGWYLFYDSGYPLGKLYPWPLMNSTMELHIITKVPFQTIGNLTDDIIFPPEYEEAIYANSIVRTRMAFQLPVDPVAVGLAKTSLNTLRQANTQIPTMVVPPSIRNFGSGSYNAFSDSNGPWGG